MKLTEHFSLEEMTFSATAARRGIDNSIRPNLLKPYLCVGMPLGHVYEANPLCENLKHLCETILEPLVILKPVSLNQALLKITSGYRSPKLNKAVGGSAKSQHTKGLAADIQVAGLSAYQLCLKIQEFRLPYDQLINEFGAWCHVSVAAVGDKPRKQTLTAVKNERGRTVYKPGLVL